MQIQNPRKQRAQRPWPTGPLRPPRKAFQTQKKIDWRLFNRSRSGCQVFAPTGEGGSGPENEKNLAALREAHPELRHKLATSNFRTDTVADTLADSTRHGLPIRVKPDAFDAASFDEQIFDSSNPPNKSKSIRVIVTDLRKPDSLVAMTEGLNVSTDAQIYELIDMLFRKGSKIF